MVLPQLHCTEHDYFSATYIVVAADGVVIIFSSPLDFIEIGALCSDDVGSNSSSTNAHQQSYLHVLTTAIAGHMFMSLSAV